MEMLLEEVGELRHELGRGREVVWKLGMKELRRYRRDLRREVNV
jgi:hypothetical protein